MFSRARSFGWTSLILIVSIAGWLIPAQVRAAGFATTSQSATASAMGNIGTANPDEPNASYYNPAATPFQPGFRAYLGSTFTAPKSTYIHPDGSEVTAKRKFLPTPNLHLGYATEDGLAAGLGANIPFGQSIEWDADWRGRADVVEQNITTVDINPTIAYLIEPANLSVALGYRLTFSSVEYARVVTARPDGEEIDMRLAGDGIGSGANAGLMWRPDNSVSLGLQYRSAVKVNYQGRTHFEGEENTPFERTFVDGRGETQITMPHVVRGGIGYRPLEKLFVELDATYTTWQTYQKLEIDFVNDKPQDSSTLRQDWSNTWTFGLGAEYHVTERLPVRLGLKFDQTPVPDNRVGPASPVNDRYAGTIGAGYTFENGLRADLAYQYTELPERDAPDSDKHLPGSYDSLGHDLIVNIGYGF